MGDHFLNVVQLAIEDLIDELEDDIEELKDEYDRPSFSDHYLDGVIESKEVVINKLKNILEVL